MPLLIQENQPSQIAEAIFLGKLDRAVRRAVPDADQTDDDERRRFLKSCMAAAKSRGLMTEQGVASYALAAWYLGIGFEAKSPHLLALLASRYPEVRKVHAMNEWAHTLIGAPDDVNAADAALIAAFHNTAAWGGHR